MHAQTELEKLIDLVPDWLRESGSEKYLLQLFVSFFDAKNHGAMNEINRSYERWELGIPAFLRVIDLRALKLALPTTSFSKPSDGVLHWFHKIEEKDIEPGVYVCLGAPFDTQEVSGARGEYDAKVGLGSLASMVSLLYGSACLHSIKCEFVIDLKTGSYSVSSDVIENPAFFRIDHIRDIPLAETLGLAKKLEAAPTEKKRLIDVALSYVNRALREPNHGIRLAQYFSAVEVLAGGISKNDVCKLLRISHSDLDLLGYSDLYTRRNKFMHEGKATQLERWEERILQYFIVDIIGSLAGLASTEYAMAFQAALKNLNISEHVRGEVGAE